MSKIRIDEKNRSNLTLDQIYESIKGMYVPLYGISEGHTYTPPTREPGLYEWSEFLNCEERALIKVGIHHLQVLLNAVDGYRSHCEEIVDLISLDRYSKLEFFEHPVAEVKIEKIEIDQETPLDDDEEHGFWGSTRGWQFIDRDGHVWIQVGTSNYDDYYPCFFLRWNARPTNNAA